MVGGTIMVGVGTMAAGVMGIGIMDTVASESFARTSSYN